MQPAACDTEAVGQSKACLTKRYTTFPIYHFSHIPLLPYTTFLPLFAFSALGVQGRAGLGEDGSSDTERSKAGSNGRVEGQWVGVGVS